MKFCIFLSLSISLIFYGIASPTQHEFRLENYFTGTHAFYSSDRIQSPHIINTIDLGFSFIYYVRSENAHIVRPLFKNIDGESITLDNNLDTNNILRRLGASEVSQSNFSELDILYAYSPKIPTYIIAHGQSINIQIVQRGNTTTIGWPVILGSY